MYNAALIDSPSIAICIPSTAGRHPSIFWAMQLKLYTIPYKHKVLMRTDYAVDLNREGLAELALAEGVSHILWWDDDIWPPMGAVSRMMAHRAPIVSGNYVDKKGWSIAARFNADDMMVQRAEPQGDGHILVDMVGLGFCLMETRILTQLPKPWFVYKPEQGEDAYFFRQVHDLLQIPVVLDYQIACGHENVALRYPQGWRAVFEPQPEVTQVAYRPD